MRRSAHPVRTAAAVAALAVHAAAHAQSFTTGASATFALRWAEHNGNDNGLLEPGESALLELDFSFTGQNTVVSFAPPIGTFGSGTLRGLGWGWIDLRGTGGTQGTWNLDQNQSYGVHPTWDLTAMGSGMVSPDRTGVDTIQFGQFVNLAAVNTTNPIIAVWRALWTPDTYAPRTATFAFAIPPNVQPASAAIVIRLSGGLLADVFLPPQNIVLGTVHIPIIPAPPSALILVFAGLCTGRPHRKSLA